MSKQEVLAAYNSDAEKLNSIPFSTEVSWKVDVERFRYNEDGQLKVVSLIPSNMGNGFNYIKTVTHLKKSRDFLLDLGYKITHTNDAWSRPQAFVGEAFAYGLVLQNPTNKNYVNIYCVKEKGSYVPLLYIFNKKYLFDHFEENKASNKQESGF